MRSEPPEALIDLLGRLQLATPDEVLAVAPRVRRLAGELPDFENVWVDALAQARLLSPFQAAQINAGRGEALLCGAYVLLDRLPAPHYCECFAARHVDEQRLVRLYRVRQLQVPAAIAARQLAGLSEQLAPLRGPATAVIDDSGITADCVWATCPAVSGTPASSWVSQNGRFAPPAVLSIARSMTESLSHLELLGAVHGDIGAAGLIIQPSGRLFLPMPGLRGLVRPSEGYSFNDLPGEAFDYLAPERVAQGTPPNVTSDLFACGCLWWHLLAGRPPLAGGNSLGKLKSAHAARIADVRQFAPDAPDVLADALLACLAREPAARPASFADLLELLGPPARGGHAIIARSLGEQSWLWRPLATVRAARRRRQRRIAAATTTAALAVVVALGLWQQRQDSPPSDAAIAKTVLPAKSPPIPLNPPVGQPADSNASVPAKSRVDVAVKQATAVLPILDEGPADLVLPAGRKLPLNTLALRAGQHVRGRSGQRPLVAVSSSGLSIPCDDVHFEGIDFVWEGAAHGKNANAPAAMIRVRSQSVEFRGCSFTSSSEQPPVAIAWYGDSAAPPDSTAELVLENCVFQGLAAVIDVHQRDHLTVEAGNTLCVASGPLVLLHNAPTTGAMLSLSLAHVTIRGDSAVLECHQAVGDAEPGQIAIAVDNCALAINPGVGLLTMVGSHRPDSLLRNVSWTGQGSLVTPDVALLVWRRAAGQVQHLADDALDVAGLVRSDVEFAAAAGGPPAASRILRWQAPLRSADPPGADTSLLFVPE